MTVLGLGSSLLVIIIIIIILRVSVKIHIGYYPKIHISYK